LAKWVPADCEPWALPPDWASHQLAGTEPEIDVLDWAHAAIKETSRRIQAANAERREVRALLEEHAEGWQAERSIEPLQGKLAELRQEYRRAGAHDRARRALEARRTKLAEEDAELARLRESGLD